MTYTPHPGFPIGTRVRVVDYVYSNVGRNGKEGVVTAPSADSDPASEYVFVDHPGDPAFPYLPKELEVLSSPRPFAVGDRVRLADDTFFFHTARGKTATIAEIDPYGNVHLKVDVDDGGSPLTQWDTNDGEHLTLIEPATPTTATTLRARADALLAEAKTKREKAEDLHTRGNALQDEAYKADHLAAQYRAVASDLEAQQ